MFHPAPADALQLTEPAGCLGSNPEAFPTPHQGEWDRRAERSRGQGACQQHAAGLGALREQHTARGTEPRGSPELGEEDKQGENYQKWHMCCGQCPSRRHRLSYSAIWFIKTTGRAFLSTSTSKSSLQFQLAAPLPFPLQSWPKRCLRIASPTKNKLYLPICGKSQLVSWLSLPSSQHPGDVLGSPCSVSNHGMFSKFNNLRRTSTEKKKKQPKVPLKYRNREIYENLLFVSLLWRDALHK